MSIKIRGIEYHFNQHQFDETLPNLVLLHGFLGSGEVYGDLISKLCKFCNPVTVDLLGHGQTDGAEMHYRFSTREQVADLAKLIREQLTIPPVFLYGYSMGARLALQLGLHHPELFQGLVLESGTFGIEGETERLARQSLDATRADSIIGAFEGFLSDWETMPMFETEISTQKYTAIQRAQYPVWMANSLLGFGTGTMPCVREQLPAFQLPVQLIAGKSDRTFIRINQTMNRELPNSTLAIIPESGHRVHLDQPQKLVEILDTFIAQHQLPDLEP